MITIEEPSLSPWQIRDLKQVATSALDDWETNRGHFKAVFGPAVVLGILRELERVHGDDLK